MNTQNVCVCVHVYVCICMCVCVASMLVAQMLTDLSKVTEMSPDLNPVVMLIANNYISPQLVPGAELHVPYMCVNLFYPHNYSILISTL